MSFSRNAIFFKCITLFYKLAICITTIVTNSNQNCANQLAKHIFAFPKRLRQKRVRNVNY